MTDAIIGPTDMQKVAVSAALREALKGELMLGHGQQWLWNTGVDFVKALRRQGFEITPIPKHVPRSTP